MKRRHCGVILLLKKVTISVVPLDFRNKIYFWLHFKLLLLWNTHSTLYWAKINFYSLRTYIRPRRSLKKIITADKKSKFVVQGNWFPCSRSHLIGQLQLLYAAGRGFWSDLRFKLSSPQKKTPHIHTHKLAHLTFFLVPKGATQQ